MLVRLLLRQGRARLLKLRLKNGDLLLGAGDPRLVAVELRLFLDDVGLRLLGPLHRAVAGALQIRVALEVLLRIDERCLIRRDLLTGLLDRRGFAARSAGSASSIVACAAATLARAWSSAVW